MPAPAPIQTSLPAYPVPKPAPQIAKPAMAAPGFDLGKAATGVMDADQAATVAADQQAGAEGRLATIQGRQQAEQADYVSGLHQKEAGELNALDPGAFRPNESALANMAALFTMVGMAGAFLGGKQTTGAAANAQAALTGMLKGWKEGDDLAVAQQKQVYDENVAILKDKAAHVRELYKQYEDDAVKLGIPTAQGKYIQGLVTQANADVMAARAKFAGAQATQKQADDILKVTEAYTAKQADLDTKVALADLNARIRWGTSPNTGGGGTFTPQMGELMAAMAEKGVTVPAGFRSRQQQTALYQSLLDRNPGKTPDEIADLVKNGQIDLKAMTKETQIAAGIAGRVAVAENEIAPMADLVLQTAKNIPRGSFLPINKLLVTAENQLQDPNLRTLKVQINSMLNAYDVLAARGGTDVAKREEAHSLLTTADNLANLEAGIRAFKQETDIARAAAKAAERADTVDTSPKPTKADRDWVKKHPEDRAKFIAHFGVQP